jgi:hypothetical protein
LYNENINGFSQLKIDYFLEMNCKSLVFNYSEMTLYARGLLNVSDSGWSFLDDEKKEFEWSFTAEGLFHLESGEFIPNQYLKESSDGSGYYAYDYINFISNDQIKYL